MTTQWEQIEAAAARKTESLMFPNLAPCADCGNKVSKSALLCPRCGRSCKPPRAVFRQWEWMIARGVAGGTLIWVLVYLAVQVVQLILALAAAGVR